MLYDCDSVERLLFLFFKQKTAYELRISDWSSDVCSSDLMELGLILQEHLAARERILEIARERQPVERRRSPRQIAQHRALLRARHRERLFGLFDQARLFQMAHLPHRRAPQKIDPIRLRTEERRVGKGCVSTGSSRGWTVH